MKLLTLPVKGDNDTKRGNVKKKPKKKLGFCQFQRQTQYRELRILSQKQILEMSLCHM